MQTISIHAPREGGDDTITDEHQVIQYFNPRPPRGGRRFILSRPYGS